MENYQDLFVYSAGFFIVTIASMRISKLFLKIKLPFITAMLFMGMVSGPFFIDLIPSGAIKKLNYINDFSLAYIAFAAGSELYLKELRSRFKSISWMTFGQLVVTFILGSLAVYYLSDKISFMEGMETEAIIGIAILTGTIFVARSPSSAIAVINEMRAKGPFTQTALGVTVLKDVLVIILFAICFAVAETLIIGSSLKLGFIFLLFSEIGLSFALGFLVAKVLTLVLSLRLDLRLKIALILLCGYGVYLLAYFIKSSSHEYLPFEIYIEPLLVCIIGGFVVTNYTNHRLEFIKIINKIGPWVYSAFFILTGASLALNILGNVWQIALALFVIRLLAMAIGAFTGGLLAGDPMKYNKIGWMPFVTQAGVSLGLVTIIANKYPEWGPEFAAVMIAVIVLNQIVGPPLFKWSISLVEEGHTRAGTPAFDGIRDAIIFGLEDKSIALARLLIDHGWAVKIATKKKNIEELRAPDLDIRSVPDKVDLQTLEELDARLSEAIVLLLTDEENYEINEMVYEHVGTKDVIVRLNDRVNFDKFHELGTKIVDPSTAIVNLLFDFVRSPNAASLLLGMEKDQGTVDLEVLNPNMHGIALRDLRLPPDVIILSVSRSNQMIISHGYTRLRLGDVVTIVGSNESLKNVTLRFEKPIFRNKKG